MASRRRRFGMRHPVVVDIGCGCRKPKLPSFLTSLPKPKPLKSRTPISPSTATSSCWETSATVTATATTTSSSSSSSLACSAAESPKRKPKEWKRMGPKKGEEGVAVVKESSDPYHDFRDSMLQMIVEMEIYAWDDLRDLLRRFLALNSPYHHHLILRAFAEIWAGLTSPLSPSPSSGSGFRR
ncbi:uncharacterized protein [Typha latifolia]|uniref:uncharacterized protein n=1 Tax=Typha latifolia TaxID=4733 RepID=UPI003C2F1E99